MNSKLGYLFCMDDWLALHLEGKGLENQGQASLGKRYVDSPIGMGTKYADITVPQGTSTTSGEGWFCAAQKAQEQSGRVAEAWWVPTDLANAALECPACQQWRPRRAASLLVAGCLQQTSSTLGRQKFVLTGIDVSFEYGFSVCRV